MIRYAILTILQLLFTGLSMVLAPVVVLFSNEDGWLPKGLLWFQTQDNSLDAGWRRQGNWGTYLQDGTVPTGFTRYKYRVYWLWRNPAYGFCYWPLGIPYVQSDWIIQEFTRDDSGNTLVFRAVTKDGRYFSYLDSNNRKLGYKLWWALDGDKLAPTLPPDKPGNRLPICYTPGD